MARFRPLPWREKQRLYNSRRWRALRLQIFDRDGWRCQDCGLPGALECDHISADPALFWDPKNLRALCRGCHIERHRREHENAELHRRQKAWADFARELSLER